MRLMLHHHTAALFKETLVYRLQVRHAQVKTDATVKLQAALHQVCFMLEVRLCQQKRKD